jgi:hypothetical protein
MVKKIKAYVPAAVAVLFMYATKVAFAANYTIPTQSGEDLGRRIHDLVINIGLPVGGAILLLSVAFMAVKLMLSALKSDKRAEVMEGFVPIAIGGIILGGAMFFAGVILGIGDRIFGGNQ